MNIEDFIANFSEQFDDTPRSKFTSDTRFHELDEYSSMNALALIAMVDSEYGVQLHTTDISNATTIEDLFKIISAKKGA